MTTYSADGTHQEMLSQQFAGLLPFQCLTFYIHELSNGVDVLKTWQLWRENRPENNSRLHIITTEKQPLSSAELAQKLIHFPNFNDLTTRLLAQYPPAISGVHRLIFNDERLTLDLWFGDVFDDLDPSTAPISMTHQNDSLTFAVIGAGIAGLSMVQALTQRGYAVKLIEQAEPLAGASGNPCALLLSKLPKLNRVSGNLQTMGALSTVRWWQNWANDVVVSTGALLQIDGDDLEKIKGYPTDIVQIVNRIEATEKANIACSTDYMLMPRAAGIDPQAIRTHVLASPLVTLVKAQATQLIRNNEDSIWVVLDEHAKPIAQASKIIVANAKDSISLCPTLPPLTVIRGQMSWLPAPLNAPSLALGYGGYTVRFQSDLLLGSSFVRDDQCLDIRPTEHDSNLALLRDNFPQLAEQLPPTSTWQGRVSLRALPRDSMPVVGAVPQMNDVYVLAGLGSKGFSFAPLCAELLAAQILGEAYPMTANLTAAIRSDRFIKKECIRKPYYSATKYK
jgi:tRNA 5-methylaminomethyl-2-thiouridine biosynthesis bifunctional protein